MTEQLPKLNELGFQIRPFGPCSFIIEGTPPMVHASKALLSELIGEEDLALQLCRGPYQQQDPRALIRTLFQCDIPNTSPRGKPIFLELSKGELKRRFR